MEPVYTKNEIIRLQEILINRYDVFLNNEAINLIKKSYEDLILEMENIR